MRLSTFFLLAAVGLCAALASAEQLPAQRTGRLIRVRGRRRGPQAQFGTRRVARVFQQQPIEVVEVRASPNTLYAAPEERSESIQNSFAVPAPVVEVVEVKAEAPVASYGAALAEPSVAASSSYLIGAEERVEEVEQQVAEASNSYLFPSQSAPVEVVEVVERVEEAAAPSSNYNVRVAAAAPIRAAASNVRTQTTTFTSARASAPAASASPRAEPIAIVRSVYNAPGSLGYERSFDSDFEAENGITQTVSGELRTVGDAEVMVMQGSYSYIGDDDQTYVVDWYADETGFHPSAPHLPKSVEPNHPEVAAAVEAQLRFAAEERQAAASSNVETVVDVRGQDNLAGYGDY